MKKLIILFALVFSLFAWDYSVTVASGDRADTTRLTFGTDFRGSDLFDEGLDLVFPIAPPSGMYAFFPISDPDFPGINMLTADYRSNADDEIVWLIRIEGDLSFDPRRISWNPAEYPFSGGSESVLTIGANYPGLEPETWRVMGSSSSIEAMSGQIVHIKLTSSLEDDITPPRIASHFPLNGSEHVDFMTPMQFTIRDDMSGVDSTSLSVVVSDMTIPHIDLDWGRITMGYSISYLPDGGWTPDDSVCVEINADDIADNTMTTFVFCYEISTGTLPTTPPYFNNFTVAAGDTNVLVGEDIMFDIRDDEEGIDLASIDIIVDGEVWEDITITEIPTDNYRISINAPVDGWETSTYYTVEVSACNISDTPLCTDTSFTFRTESEPSVPPFELGALNIWTSSAADTEWTDLTLGTSPDATEGYDTGFDVPSVFPPFATYAYFPLDDPDFPGIDRLATDIRRNDDVILWRIELQNPLDECGVVWDIDELLDAVEGTEGYFRIAAGESETGLYWEDMELGSTMDFETGQSVFIKFSSTPPDSEAVPPRITDRSPMPDEELVSVDTDIFFKVLDADDDVDISSLRLFFGPSADVPAEIAAGALDIVSIPSGYSVTYDIPGDLDYETDYDIRVIVSDMEGREVDVAWTFTSSPFCAPAFSQTIDLSHLSGDTLTQTRTIGTNEFALEGRDVLDTAVPMFPPGVTFFFPLDDPVYEYLERDVRPTCGGIQYWQIKANNGTAAKLASWDSTTVIDDSDWKLAIATSPASATEPPEIGDFRDMRTLSFLEYGASEMIWIVLTDEIIEIETYNITVNVSLCDDDDDITSAVVEIIETMDTLLTPPGGGGVTFSELEEGSYSIVISADTYDSETLSVYLEEDTDIDIELYSPVCDPGAIVLGQITFDGEPAVEHTVTMGWAFDVTDSSGSFNLGEWMPGEYEFFLNSDLPCYPDTCWMVEVPDIDTFRIDFDYNAPLFDVTGTITVDGEPVSGAEIYSCSDTTEPIAVSDADGEYVISGMLCGSHCIYASFPGYSNIEESFFLDSDQSIDFEFFTDMIVITIDVTTDCGDTSGVTILEDGIPVGRTHYSETAVSGSSFEFEVRGDFTTSWDTVLTSVEGDVSIEVNLHCLLPAADINASTVDLERPLPPDTEIANHIIWTLPTTSLSISNVLIHRDLAILDTLDSDATEYTDTAIVTEREYEYAVSIIYSYDGEMLESMPSEAVSVTPMIRPDPSDILVIDWDNSATPIDGSGVAESFIDLLESPEMGLTVGITLTDQDPEQLDGYELTDYGFISLHLSTGTTIPNDLLVTIMYYTLEHEGVLYVESPDFGEDFSTSSGAPMNFFNLFGIGYLAGHGGNPWSVGNVDYVRGVDPFSGREIRSDYAHMEEPDNSIDDFTLDGASLLIRDQDELIRMAKYEAEPDKWRAVSSIYLSAIDGEINFAERILAGLLWESGIVADVEGVNENELPEAFGLSIFPNPFNSSASVHFDLAGRSMVTLKLLDVKGQEVLNKELGILDIGRHNVLLEGEKLTSGAYNLVLITDGAIFSEKLVLIK